jgi:hypothetical protein
MTNSAAHRAVIYLFTTQQALDKFRSSKGWTVGADATVALATRCERQRRHQHAPAAGGRFRAHQCRAGSRHIAAGREGSSRSSPD